MNTEKINFQIDKDERIIRVMRSFNAPLEKVWNAWTTAEVLDKWWAPKPWKSETKHFHFAPGDYWLYAMVSPEGEKHWARADYESIHEQKDFSVYDAFCDEQGNINKELPRTFWKISFVENAGITQVTAELAYDTVEQLEQNLSMGFQEGFTMGLQNLEELLAGN